MLNPEILYATVMQEGVMYACLSLPAVPSKEMRKDMEKQISYGKGVTLVHRPYDHFTTKFRVREVRQAEKEDRSSNEKESRMIAERLEFQTFDNKQSQHCQPFNQGKP
eukprot:1140331-Pelagomonas_calceolata.AAC.1